MQWSSSVEVNMFLNATTATSFLARFPAKKQVGAQMHRAIYNKLLPRTGWHLMPLPPPQRLGSLSNDVFERRTSTGSCPFSLLGDGFAQIFSQIVSIRVKKLRNTNYIASRHIYSPHFRLTSVAQKRLCLSSLVYGRTLRHNQIFSDGWFTKFYYPWCSAGALRAPELRYYC